MRLHDLINVTIPGLSDPAAYLGVVAHSICLNDKAFKGINSYYHTSP